VASPAAAKEGQRGKPVAVGSAALLKGLHWAGYARADPIATCHVDRAKGQGLFICPGLAWSFAADPSQSSSLERQDGPVCAGHQPTSPYSHRSDRCEGTLYRPHLGHGEGSPGLICHYKDYARQPPELTAHRLIRTVDLPIAWAAQTPLLGLG
jgi:hypothetical protein